MGYSSFFPFGASLLLIFPSCYDWHGDDDEEDDDEDDDEDYLLWFLLFSLDRLLS